MKENTIVARVNESLIGSYLELSSRLSCRNIALLGLTSILINPIAANCAQSSPFLKVNADSYIAAQTNSNDYLNLGIERLNQEDYQGAIEKFNQALKLDSKNASAYFCRSIAYSGLGDYQNAISDYESIGKLEAKIAEQIASKKKPTYETAIVIQRRTAIINNIPLVFKVESKPQVSGSAIWYERPELSWVPSIKSPIINAAAQKYNVDADLIKAIMWVETTRGYYDSLIQGVGLNKTIQPMNIHQTLWKQMLGDRQQLMDIQTNVFAGARLISEIWKRLENPSIEKIEKIKKVATLYNQLGTYQVNDYGARVGQIYTDKPWTKEPDPVGIGVRTTIGGWLIRLPGIAVNQVREGRLALSQEISTSTVHKPHPPKLPNSEEQLVEMMNQEVSWGANNQQQATDSLSFFIAPEILALRAVEVITQTDLCPTGGDTFCNQAIEQILSRSGVNTQGWIEGKLANEIANNLAVEANAKESKRGVRLLTETDAQNLANQGKLVIACKTNPGGNGHCAIVIPYNQSLQSSTGTNKKGEAVLYGGPLVAQAGNTNAIYSAYSAFNLKSADDIPSIKYYEVTPTKKPLPLRSTPQKLLDWLNQKQLPPTVNLKSVPDGIRKSLILRVKDWQKTGKTGKTERNAALEAKLEEELKKRNSSGMPPPPPPGASFASVDLNQAQQQGIIVEATGTGDRSSLRLRVTNPHQAKWLLLDVPRGSTFNPGSLNTQRMSIR